MADTTDQLDATLRKPDSGPAVSHATPALDWTRPPQLSAAVPWTIDSVPPFAEARFEQRDVLGSGGQGVVELALDKTIGREVALKTLKDLSGTVHFLREARVTGQLEHPGIVPIYDIGRRADGSLVYAQKLVRGRTLHALFQQTPSREGRLALLPALVDVCQAVAYAHSRGVVHRDLKPANIMRGEFGETIVLDWGLAKVIGEADAPAARPVTLDPSSTRVGEVVGTPLYMAPEQARGEEPTRSSDVWSLGVILYELLAGRRPIEGDSVVQTLERVRAGVAEPLASVAPGVPPELVAVVERAMQPDPTRRFADAAALAAELATFRAGGRVTVYEYSSLELLRRFVARNKTASFVTAVLVAFLGLVGVRLAKSLNETQKQLVLAVTERAVGLEQRAHWNEAVDRLHSLEGKSDTRGDLLHRRLAESLAPQYVVRGDLPGPLVAGAFDASSHGHFLVGHRADERAGAFGFSEAALVSLDQMGRTRGRTSLGALPVRTTRAWVHAVSVDEAGTLAAIATGAELIFVDRPTGQAEVRRVALPAARVQLTPNGRNALVHLSGGGCAVLPTSTDSAAAPSRFGCSPQAAISDDGRQVSHRTRGPAALNVNAFVAPENPAPDSDAWQGESPLVVQDGVALAALDRSLALARRDLSTGLVATADTEGPLDWISVCRGGKLVAGGTRKGVQLWAGEELEPAAFVQLQAESPSLGRFRRDACVLDVANDLGWYEIDATRALSQVPVAWPSRVKALAPGPSGEGILIGGDVGSQALLDLQPGRAGARSEVSDAVKGAAPIDDGAPGEDAVASGTSPCGNAQAVADSEGRLRFRALPADPKQPEWSPFVAPFRGIRHLAWTKRGLAMADDEDRLFFWQLDVCATK